MEGRPLNAADGAGRVEALWTQRAHGGVMDPRREATFVAGKGIDGNTCRSSTRQVTIISREAWEAATRDLGTAVDPSARRANVMVSGVDLAGSRGKVLRLGATRVRILGETRPCEQMDAAREGLRAALGPDWRGGVFGQVLDDGIVTVGDRAEWDSDR